MKIRTLALLGAALLLPFGAVACGDDGDTGTASDGKPSVDAITKKFTATEIPKEQSRCLAEALHSSLSAATLNKIMAGNTDDTLGNDIGKDLTVAENQKLAGAMGKCLGVDAGTVPSTPAG